MNLEMEVLPFCPFVCNLTSNVQLAKFRFILVHAYLNSFNAILVAASSSHEPIMLGA